MTLARGLQDEMSQPKYAHLERERRWLVDRHSRPSLEGCSMTLIEDRYISGTRMRLRRMSRPDLGRVVLKLTKKYESSAPSARPIVTTYLTDAEFDLFHALPARELVKRRYQLQVGDRDWSIDLFERSLQGLEILECEVGDTEPLSELEPPSCAVREITDLPNWQCGALAAMQAIPE